MLLSSQKYINQLLLLIYILILINLHPNEYEYIGSYNTIDDLSSRVCVPNETEDLNLHAFNMTTGIKESRSLIMQYIMQMWM